MSWYPHACPVCNGDLYDDAMDKGDVTCMMCARSFAAANVMAVQRIKRGQPVAAPELQKAA